eukprot:Nk52_evm16s272 gene=Nk52_evmTU16s272
MSSHARRTSKDLPLTERDRRRSLRGTNSASSSRPIVSSSASSTSLIPAKYAGGLAAGTYMLVSVLLILFNKAVLSRYSFKYPNILTMLQCITSIFLLRLFKWYRMIDLPDFSKAKFKILLPLNAAFIFYMVLGMIAIDVVEIQMYTALRRATVVFVLVGEFIMQGKLPTAFTVQAVCVMLLGAAISGWRDAKFDLLSYLIVGLYNSITALYLVLINRASQQIKPSSFELMFYNSLVCGPAVFVIAVLRNEFFSAINDFPHWHEFGFQVGALGSASLAFVLNYSIFWNTSVNSALTQTISGQMKDVLTVLIGVYLMVDQEMDMLAWLGVMVGFLGSGWYAYGKVMKMT